VSKKATWLIPCSWTMSRNYASWSLGICMDQLRNSMGSRRNMLKKEHFSWQNWQKVMRLKHSLTKKSKI
jgi:hypothetical protein